MIVMKFGGSSLATADEIRKVFGLVTAEHDRDPIVVASALGDVTKRLSALMGDDNAELAGMESLEALHRDLLAALGLPTDLLDDDLHELHELLNGIRLVGELTARTRDLVLSYGERMSVQVIAAYFTAQGLVSQAVNAYDIGFITDAQFGSASVLAGQEQEIATAVKKIEALPIVTGFIGKTRANVVTTLGRSGATVTAVTLAATFNADEVQIWTTVDGIMTADPSIVPAAQTISQMSFAEAAELAFFSPKILHPASLQAAMQKDIPVRVLNSLRPEQAGTVIRLSGENSSQLVKSIVYKEDQILVQIISSRMLLNYGFMAKVFNVFNLAGVSIDMIATSEVSVSLTVSSMDGLDEVVETLSAFSTVTVEPQHAVVSVVGLGVCDRLGIAGEIFNAISQVDVPIKMISVGASKINISFVVANDSIDTAVQVLHKTFFDG